jgi:hypothetical protein
LNLIKREYHESSIITFRAFQYSLIPELISLSIRYLVKLGLKYNPNIYNLDGSTIEFEDAVMYTGFQNYSTQLVQIDLVNKNDKFIKMSVPELVHGLFFIIGGVRYIPSYYIIDEPITCKKHSIMIHSLFQPITVYIKDNRVIFMRTNIVLDDFIKIIGFDWDNDYKKEFYNKFNIDLFASPNTKTLNTLSKKLNCTADPIDIKNKIKLVFFDEWTVELYKHFYNIDSSLNEIFKIALARYIDSNLSFIDLRYKRISFIEMLMTPFFKHVSRLAIGLLTSGFQRHTLGVALNSISDHFIKELSGINNYNTVNGYSSVLAHRASFKNPFGSGSLPQEVSAIHWTHRDRICITSITNQNPGVNVFLIPDQEIDMKFGIFKFTDEQMKQK